jgi:hypothetical protein
MTSHKSAPPSSACARFLGTDHQIDTYFRVPSGRLKIRKGRIENALIFYQRPNTARARRSTIDMMLLPRRNSVRTILAGSLGILAVVDKRREIYFAGNVMLRSISTGSAAWGSLWKWRQSRSRATSTRCARKPDNSRSFSPSPRLTLSHCPIATWSAKDERRARSNGLRGARTVRRPTVCGTLLYFNLSRGFHAAPTRHPSGPGVPPHPAHDGVSR